MEVSPKTKLLIEKSMSLLSNKTSLNSFWQNIAENFYPQRAFFTSRNPIPYGRDFASHLTTSFPILVAQEYASLISAYLRPAGQQWFEIGIDNKGQNREIDNDGKRFLEEATRIQTNVIKDRKSGFSIAVDQGDADFASFGQCVISIEIDWKNVTLLHRCWNMRDVAWAQGPNGLINYVCREWKTTIRNAKSFFGDKLSPETLRKSHDQGDAELIIHHIVMETEEYYNTYSDKESKEQKIKSPYVSLYVQLEGNHEIEIVGSPTIIYFIPRDQLVSGSQYAYSRAVVAALPDARLLQSITLSLLEAGEKAVNPPLLAQEDAVRDDISLAANTINFVATNEGQRIDDIVKVMNLDRSGLQYGLTMQADIRESQRNAFFLNKLSLPQLQGEMTATEVRKRYQEWIRNASPFVDRLETEYNQQLVKMQFETLMHVKAFGFDEEMPDSIRDDFLKGDITFNFRNPLVEAEGEEDAQKFLEMKGIIADTAALDPSVANIPKVEIALRDALEGLGIPAKWLKSEDEVAELNEQQAQVQKTQQMIQSLADGGAAAEQLGKGAQAIQQAELN